LETLIPEVRIVDFSGHPDGKLETAPDFSEKSGAVPFFRYRVEKCPARGGITISKLN
jgi:hypothetical protein